MLACRTLYNILGHSRMQSNLQYSYDIRLYMLKTIHVNISFQWLKIWHMYEKIVGSNPFWGIMWVSSWHYPPSLTTHITGRMVCITRILAMKCGDHVRDIGKICCRFLSSIIGYIAYPINQVIQLVLQDFSIANGSNLKLRSFQELNRWCGICKKT